MKLEKLERDGVVYERYVHDNNGSDHFTKQGHPGPDVLCGKCHGDKFTLRYGSYECIAKCIVCGYEAVVYDG